MGPEKRKSSVRQKGSYFKKTNFALPFAINTIDEQIDYACTSRPVDTLLALF
jgi:hypothetical protein